MEKWYDFVENYSEAGGGSDNPEQFNKVLDIASKVFKEDLADFEVDFVIKALLFTPVNLLVTVAKGKDIESWLQVVTKSIKLLTDIVDKHGEFINGKHFESISKLCRLPYNPTLRNYVLLCLSAVAKHNCVHVIGAIQPEMLIDVHNKTASAQLIGVVVRYHPEVISDDIQRYWRTYLIQLQSSDNSDKLLNAILIGIHGILKHFGDSLYTMELNDFYDKLVLLRGSSCDQVLNILRDHAALFQEKLLADQGLRVFLWSRLPKSAKTVVSVYRVLKGHNTFTDIINKEVIPRVNSFNAVEKYTALRIVSGIQDVNQYVDIHTIIFELNSGDIRDHIYEGAVWCLETNFPDSDKLMQAFIKNLDLIPRNKRVVLLQHGVLSKNLELRDFTMKFLISEYCNPVQTEEVKNKVHRVWSIIFEAEPIEGLEFKSTLYDEFLYYALQVLHVLDEDREISEEVKSLLQLTAHVIKLNDRKNAWFAHALKPCLNILEAKKLLVACLKEDNSVDLTKTIDLRRCLDEPTLSESCLCVVHAPREARFSSDTVILAMKIILSTKTVDFESLTVALNKLDTLLLDDKESLDQNTLNNVFTKISNLQVKQYSSDKIERILYRQINRFLGKFVNQGFYDSSIANKNYLMSKIELTFDISNTFDGNSYKIPLKRLLHLAVVQENPKAMISLLALLRRDEFQPHLADISALLTVALCVCHVRGESLDTAFLRLDDRVIEYLPSQISPGLRRMLCDGLQESLPGLRPQTARIVYERAASMLASADVNTIRAGLELCETLVQTLKVNTSNQLAEELLPEILKVLSNIHETGSDSIFNMTATVIARDKIYLFDKNSEIFEDFLKTVLINLSTARFDSRDVDYDVKLTVFRKMAARFVLFLKEIKDTDDFSVLNFIKHNGGNLYLLAEARCLIKTEDAKVFLKENVNIIDGVFRNFDFRTYSFDYECSLYFVTKYADIVLDLKYQHTREFLSKVVDNLTLLILDRGQTIIKNCFNTYREQFESLPDQIDRSIKKLISELPLSNITTELESLNLTMDSINSLNFLKIILHCFCKDISYVDSQIKLWPEKLLRQFADNSIIFKDNLSTFTDVMRVSLSFLTVDQLKQLISERSTLEAEERLGLEFCRFFILVFYEVLLKNKEILSDAGMEECTILLNDIVRFSVRNNRNEDKQTIMDLVNQLWTPYELHSKFKEKIELLLALSSLSGGVNFDSNWVLTQISSPRTKLEEKNELIRVLPSGRSRVLQEILISAPVCLSEWRNSWRETFAAILDLLSTSKDLEVMKIVAKLADGEKRTGFWDDEFKSCAATLADNEEIAVFLFEYCLRSASVNVTERLLLPLLRFSKRSFCEDFFSTRINKLLRILSAKDEPYVSKTRACLILVVCFEKLSKSTLESPTSILYKYIEAQSPKPWYLARETFKKNNLLIGVRPTSEAKLQEWRRLQSARYNLMSAAVVSWGVTQDVAVRLVCSSQAFSGLIGSVNLPLRSWYNRRRQESFVPLAHKMAAVTSRSATLFSRAFLRTLSECPFRYDLTKDEEELPEVQELVLPDNELSRHPCVVTLTSVMCHLSQLSNEAWKRDLVEFLTGTSAAEEKWLVCQVICNCKQELQNHCDVLSPALLQVLADTACISLPDTATNELRRIRDLNDLHVYIIDTLTFWGKPDNMSAQFLKNLKNALSLVVDALMTKELYESVFRHLSDISESFLKVFGDVLSLEDDVCLALVDKGIKTPKENKSKLQNIILSLLKYKIKIKSLLPEIQTLINSRGYWGGSKMAEIFGAAMNVETSDSDKRIAMSEFNKFIMGCDKSVYVQCLLSAQRYYPEICDQKHIRKIINSVPKIGLAWKRSLHIISDYIKSNKSSYIRDIFENIVICELLTGEFAAEALATVENGYDFIDERTKCRMEGLLLSLCRSTIDGVRYNALKVIGVVLREKLHPNNELSEPSTKNMKLVSSLMLRNPNLSSFWGCLAVGALDKTERIARFSKDILKEYLCEDLYVRYIECLSLMYHMQSNNSNNVTTVSLTDCVAVILNLLFLKIRETDTWKKLGIELKKKIESADCHTGSVMLTNSRTYQGTYNRTNVAKIPVQEKGEQGTRTLMMEDIWSSFVEFVQENTKAARLLFQATSESIIKRENTSNDNELLSIVKKLLSFTTNLTPLTVDTCRIMVKQDFDCKELQPEVLHLYSTVRNAIGFESVTLLQEEMLIKYGGYQYFCLGLTSDYRTIVENMEVDRKFRPQDSFSILNVSEAFGQLSNWDNLTIQQRQAVIDRGLPVLWRGQPEVLRCIDDYQSGQIEASWFDALVLAFKDDSDIQLKLSKLLRSPIVTYFERSTLLEATEWVTNEKLMEGNRWPFSCDILPQDCLVAWAARLTIRAAYLSKLNLDEEANVSNMKALSRSHELKWCQRANEMGIPGLVRQCVKRNADSDFVSSELLPWQYENILSLHLEGKQDKTKLRQTLIQSKEEYKNSVTDNVFMVKTNSLIVELSKNDESSLEDIRKVVLETRALSHQTMNNISYILKFYETALLYYNGLCREPSITSDNIDAMADIICHMHDITSKISLCLIDLVILKLEMLVDTECSYKVRDILKKLKHLPHDDFILQKVSKLNSRVSPSGAPLFPDATPTQDLVDVASCLQLMADPEHRLMQFCFTLLDDCENNDTVKWKSDFDKMKARIFENRFAGKDYGLLQKYKNTIYNLECALDPNSTNKTNVKEELETIMKSLSLSNARPRLMLSQLCPTLADCSQYREVLSKLLRLPDGVTVVKFEEEIKVYTDSIRRPTVVRARLSTGHTATYMHKTGEPLARDAAAQRLVKILSEFGLKATYYNVTVLDEDSALIQFLEDHRRLRDVILSEVDLQAIERINVGPTDDSELILCSSNTLIERYKKYCEVVPADGLRTAMEKESTTVEEFLMKINNFQDSLAAMTIVCWILGLDDRHLHNILQAPSGAACVVDCGSLLRQPLPAARLTRSLLAATRDLESRLQQAWALLRGPKSELLLASVNLAISALGQEFEDKLHYIEDTIKGTVLPYEVSIDALKNSTARHKERYIELLTRVCGQPKKHSYNVQEQISSLLLQCTSPEILGTMRSAWEPWL